MNCFKKVIVAIVIMLIITNISVDWNIKQPIRIGENVFAAPEWWEFVKQVSLDEISSSKYRKFYLLYNSKGYWYFGWNLYNSSNEKVGYGTLMGLYGDQFDIYNYIWEFYTDTPTPRYLGQLSLINGVPSEQITVNDYHEIVVK